MTARGGLDVPPPDPRLYAVLANAGFGDDVFNPGQHRACELVERYALDLTVTVVDELGLARLLGRPRALEDLLTTAGFVPGFHTPLCWLLARLAAAGIVSRDGDRFRMSGPLPATSLGALRSAILAVEPSYAPALALLDEAAALYPRVARGETTGEQALFRRAALWFAYFSNTNRYYAINNRVAAAAVAGRLRPGGRVLEVGAGLGSATEALLERADVRIESYRMTEPVPLFRRRAERTLGAAHPGVPFRVDALDVNRPWSEQGIAPASVDLVWGVNVFHLARDLDAVLAEARAALAADGWLVIGEGVRPASTTPVGAELPFQLLESWRDVLLHPARRPTPGFLTAEHWIGALGRAGFEDIAVVPDAIRLRAIHPGFYAAALCARAPADHAAGRRA